MYRYFDYGTCTMLHEVYSNGLNTKDKMLLKCGVHFCITTHIIDDTINNMIYPVMQGINAFYN